MFRTYLIHDENTTYIAIFNGEGEYILDRFDGDAFNVDGIAVDDYGDMEDYNEAILRRAVELDEYDAGMYWTNCAGGIAEIEKADDINDVLDRVWWSKGHRAIYTEV